MNKPFSETHPSLKDLITSYPSIHTQKKFWVPAESVQRFTLDKAVVRAALDEVFGNSKALLDCSNKSHREDGYNNYPERQDCPNWSVCDGDEYYSFCRCGNLLYLKMKMLQKLGLDQDGDA
jgi:hypothetical protein